MKWVGIEPTTEYPIGLQPTALTTQPPLLKSGRVRIELTRTRGNEPPLTPVTPDINII